MDKDTYGVELELIIGKFKNKMNEVKDMMSEVKNKYEIEIDPDFDLDKLESEFRKAFIELSKFKNVKVLSPEQLEQASLLNLYMEKLNERMVQLGGKPLRFTEKMKETSDETKEVAKNMDVISVKARASGNGISNAMSKGVKSLKRFALSLFGIQSVWRLISRATSNYLSQNTQLSNKLKSVWTGLGTLLGPVVDFLADLFLKLLGYINVVTKALFNFDFIAKANANTMKNYQKQVSKTAKALSGLDEITNLQQHNEDDEGPNLIQTPELNEGIVKKLQDFSKLLKDNKEKIELFAGAVALLIGSKTLMTGLLGLGSVLGSLLTIGVITVGVDLLYNWLTGRDLIEDLKEIYDGLKDMKTYVSDKQYKKVKSNVEGRKEEARAYQKGSVEIKNYIALLKDQIETGKKMSLLDKNETELTYQLIGNYRDLYEQGKLTTEQTQEYAEFMKELGLNMDGTTRSGIDLVDALKNGDKELDYFESITGKVSDTIGKTDGKVKNLKDNIGNLGGALGVAVGELKNYDSKVDTTGGKVDSMKTKVENLYTRLNEITKKKYGIDLQTKFGVNADDLRRILNNFKNTGLAKLFNFDKMIDRFLKTIPGFAIGTDLVKSDGLAYLHAGEKVVPANAVGGGYTGSDGTNDLLRELIEVVENKNFVATISENDVGSASVNYIRKQNRIMGGSVI